MSTSQDPRPHHQQGHVPASCPCLRSDAEAVCPRLRAPDAVVRPYAEAPASGRAVPGPLFENEVPGSGPVARLRDTDASPCAPDCGGSRE
ncbi:hypothetical protein [Streptomyces boncukensis]|uniref:Uncharacterized protein n=1 Tax=Streptomyces boncukensis TaxID=2711219 RepID=A0A6G4X0W1_9ACTN|nr:hypothetical protein [Streptomyces boncukensis]NGO71189.1 hypothetical protein [Streptomyces boncukensis]